LSEGGRPRHDRGRRQGSAQFREVHPLFRAPEGGAGVRRGDCLAPRQRRCILGAHDWPHARPAELAQASEHRSSPGARGNVGVHGARLRERGSAKALQVRSAVLGQAEARMKRLFLLAALLWIGAACAQSYPTKPIKIIVPFTPGSATDVMGRIVSERLNAAWGQPVIVDNRPGAGGTIGIRETARAEPDGYTLVLVSSGHAVNHVLYKDLGYDTLKDFAAVAMLGSLPSVLIVPPNSPVNSVKELVAMLKAKPGQYNYASAGVGSGAHVSLEKFNVAAGVKAVHVPLKGTPPILTE